jgi:hypothetical protein
MICFEIYINGQKVCLAGVGSDGVLSAMATFIASSKSQNTDFRVSGLSKVDAETSQQIEWLDRELSIGDVLTIKVVETENYDIPPSQKIVYVQCSFCGKKEAEVVTLIAGANNYICNECVISCSQAIRENTAIGNISLFNSETNTSCSLCGKQNSEVERIVGVAENRICNQCVDICEAIIRSKTS